MDDEADRVEARQAALYLALAGVVACLVATIVWESAALTWRPWFALTIFDAICLAAVWMSPRLSRPSALAIFSLEVLVAVLVFWVTAEAQAAIGRPFAPFNGYKILGLLVAVLCPSLRLGYALIALMTIGPIVQLLHWGAETRQLMPQLEPWQTLIGGALAVVFLYVRRRHADRVMELTRVRAETMWLERVARLGLLVRDHMQALVIRLERSLATLELHHPKTKATAVHMGRAATRLDRLCETLTPLRPIVPESAKTDASMAAIQRALLDVQAMHAALSGTRARRLAEATAADVKVEARRATVALTAIALVGAVLLEVAEVTTPGFSRLPAPLAIGSCLFALAITFGWPRVSVYVHHALYVLVGVGAITAVLLNNDAMAARGHFDAFPGMKLALLAFAFTAPSRNVGAFLIVLGSAGPVVETYAFWTIEQRGHMPLLEPWPTVFIGATAMVLLFVHRRHIALIRALASAHAERDGIARIARMVLAVRDLANTPLQILSISLELDADVSETCEVQAVAASVAELRELVQALPMFELDDEGSSAQLSFDALEDIAREVRRITESRGLPPTDR